MSKQIRGWEYVLPVKVFLTPVQCHGCREEVEASQHSMHSVCRCSLLVWRKSSLKKGTLRDLLLSCPESNQGRKSCPPSPPKKKTTHVRDFKFFMPTKFYQKPLRSSIVRLTYSYTYTCISAHPLPPLSLSSGEPNKSCQKVTRLPRPGNHH